MSSEEELGLIKTFSNSVIYRNIFSKFSLQKISCTLRFSKNIQIWLQMTLAKLCLLTQTVNLPCWDPARELREEELLSIHSIVVANTRKKNPCCWKSLNSHTSFLSISLAMSLWCTVCIQTAVYCNMYCKKSSASGFRVLILQPNTYNDQAKVFGNIIKIDNMYDSFIPLILVN